MTKTLTHNNI